MFMPQKLGYNLNADLLVISMNFCLFLGLYKFKAFPWIPKSSDFLQITYL